MEFLVMYKLVQIGNFVWNYFCTTGTENGQYEFGYNGQYKDNEVAGTGNHLDFGARMENTRIARFFSIDPLIKKTPWSSPYSFAGGNPIKFIDKNGMLKIDPKISEDYPLISAYLSTQLEKDIMKSTAIINAYKIVNPYVTDDNIRSVFKDGSGPILVVDKNPGSLGAKALGFTNYNQNESMIEPNVKIFAAVENTLKNSTNKAERQKALMFLVMELTHEGAHEMIGFKNGKKMSYGEHYLEQAKQEPGYVFEQEAWGIPPFTTEEQEKSGEYIEDLDSINPKNKKVEIEKVINNANLTKDGKQSLPTVPQAPQK